MAFSGQANAHFSQLVHLARLISGFDLPTPSMGIIATLISGHSPAHFSQLVHLERSSKGSLRFRRSSTTLSAYLSSLRSSGLNTSLDLSRSASSNSTVSWIATVGHTSTQSPQNRHLPMSMPGRSILPSSGSSSFCIHMQSFGQICTQLLHPMHLLKSRVCFPLYVGGRLSFWYG